jgi:ATP/maltotriose-dependent transcriptional regulator MalT
MAEILLLVNGLTTPGRLASTAMYDALRDSLPTITERQKQVIELIAAGCSNDEVGERLGISPRTAKAHSDVLRQKLGVTRRRQIPVAYRALTGDDPLSRSLKSAAADSEG